MTTHLTPDRATIGLVSDTHGWLDEELLEIFSGVDAIVHAGDIGDQSVLDQLEALAPVLAVRGNIDGGDLRFLPYEAQIEVAGRRIASMHIAGSPRRPNKAAIALLKRMRPDAFIVGHSHIPVVGQVEGALWINPGAAGRNGFHTERFAALLHIDRVTRRFTLDRIHLGPRSKQAGGLLGPDELWPDEDL
ncbi:MAG: metallophosphoesterase family protein [Bradymonadaceae bacterium]